MQQRSQAVSEITNKNIYEVAAALSSALVNATNENTFYRMSARLEGKKMIVSFLYGSYYDSKNDEDKKTITKSLLARSKKFLKAKNYVGYTVEVEKSDTIFDSEMIADSELDQIENNLKNLLPVTKEGWPKSYSLHDRHALLRTIVIEKVIFNGNIKDLFSSVKDVRRLLLTDYYKVFLEYTERQAALEKKDFKYFNETDYVGLSESNAPSVHWLQLQSVVKLCEKRISFRMKLLVDSQPILDAMSKFVMTNKYIEMALSGVDPSIINKFFVMKFDGLFQVSKNKAELFYQNLSKHRSMWIEDIHSLEKFKDSKLDALSKLENETKRSKDNATDKQTQAPMTTAPSPLPCRFFQPSASIDVDVSHTYYALINKEIDERIRQRQQAKLNKNCHEQKITEKQDVNHGKIYYCKIDQKIVEMNAFQLIKGKEIYISIFQGKMILDHEQGGAFIDVMERAKLIARDSLGMSGIKVFGSIAFVKSYKSSDRLLCVSHVPTDDPSCVFVPQRFLSHDEYDIFLRQSLKEMNHYAQKCRQQYVLTSHKPSFVMTPPMG